MDVRRALLWTCLSFLAGIATGLRTDLALSPVLGIAALLGLACFWAAGRTGLVAAAVLACAFATGLASGASARRPPGADELAGFVGQVVEAEGLATSGGSRFVLEAHRVLIPPGARASRVLVRGNTPVAVGDRVRVRGRVLPLPQARNPGEPDPSRFLYRDRVRAVLKAERVAVLEASRGFPLLRAAARVRTALQAVYRRALLPPLDAMLAGVVLGIPVPDRELREAFRQSGLVHLLVASGAQLSAVATAAYLVLRRCRRTLRGIGSLLAVLWFAVVAGWEPSMARAAVMATVAVAAGMLRREPDPATLLAVAAAALAASNPLLLWDVGFQLSFAATGALVFVAPALQSLLRFGPAWVREGVAAATACQLLLFPLLLWHFKQLHPWAVVANLLALPASSFVVPVGLLGGLVGLVWIPLAVPILWSAGAGCAYLVWVARTVSALPGATAHVAYPELLATVLGVWALLGVACYRGRLRLPHAALGAAAALAVAVWVRALAPPRYAEVVFLDVGQGDAVVARGPEGHYVVLDGGPEPQPLLRYLASLGGRVDVALLSHAHADHVVGLTHVLRKFGAGVVLDSGYPHPTPAYADFLRTVRERSIPYRVARRGIRVELGREGTLEVLWPPASLWEGPSGVNENSLVVLLRWGQVRFLFPGDVEAGAEGALVASGQDLRAHVLKVPHQGSRTSSSEAFLRAVAPQVAVLSVGTGNPYGHPHREVLARYARHGISLYRTDRDGAVVVRTDGRALWVQITRSRWCCTAW